jgi:hypothetical protein
MSRFRDEMIYHFQELPAYMDPHNDTVAGMLDGWATIRHDGPADWSVCKIVLDAHNGKFGKLAESRRVEITRMQHHYLWDTIVRGLEETCADQIAEDIRESAATDYEMAEERI